MQSKDYLSIARAEVKIIEAQTKLREQKENIHAKIIDDIFKSVNDSTQEFRRNRMGFID
jgi:hypothetical protein